MLTIDEIVLTLLALLGVGYNAFWVAVKKEPRLSKQAYIWHIVLYALFVVLPQLSVILYAFMHMRLD